MILNRGRGDRGDYRRENKKERRPREMEGGGDDIFVVKNVEKGVVAVTEGVKV